MERFAINIFWSDEDHAFVANAPELPGCMAHGDTHEAALAEVKQAMSLWLEAARAAGRTVPLSHQHPQCPVTPPNKTPQA